MSNSKGAFAAYAHSDSSTYEKTAGWEKEYVNGFMEEAKSGKYDFVFVCQTKSVIDEMDRRKIPYIIVEPDNIVWNKQEAEERAKERQIIKQQWFGRFVLRNNSHIKDFSKWLSHMKDIYDERDLILLQSIIRYRFSS